MKKTLKFNKQCGQYLVGQVVEVAVDTNGNPLDNFLFRRVKDSAIDNCVEWVTNEPAASTTSKRKQTQKSED